MAEYANPNVLVTTAWVAEHLSDQSLRLVEVDVDTSAYERGHIKSAAYKAKEPRANLRAKRDLVFSYLGGGLDINLVDVRSVDEFTGKVIAPPGMSETAQRGGHIPGAKSIPWLQTVNEDGTFKSADDLKTLYESRGVLSAKETVAYCRIGERSSHSWFVLKYLLGYPQVRNYDGSWTEWGNLVGAPIEK